MRVLLVGNGPFANRGCEAIVRGTLQILKKCAPGADVHNYFLPPPDSRTGEESATSTKDWIYSRALPLSPFAPRYSYLWWISQASRYLGTHKFRGSVCRQFQKDLSNYFPQAKIALQVGGDNYTFDYGIPLLNTTIDKTLLAAGIPICLWGASVGRFDGSVFDRRWMLWHLRKHMRAIFVRESESLTYLRECGLGDLCTLTSDPAFLMEPIRPHRKELHSSRFAGAIGVNLSPLIGRIRQRLKLTSDWLREVREIILKLRERFQRPLVLVPHVMECGNSDHVMFEKAIGSLNSKSEDIFLLPKDLSAPELKWIIGQLDLFIAARMHAGIAAMASCVPTVLISYSPKAKGLSDQVYGHRKLVLEANELCPATLVERVMLAFHERDDLRSRLHARIPSIRELGMTAGEVLSNLVNE